MKIKPLSFYSYHLSRDMSNIKTSAIVTTTKNYESFQKLNSIKKKNKRCIKTSDQMQHIDYLIDIDAVKLKYQQQCNIWRKMRAILVCSIKIAFHSF